MAGDDVDVADHLQTLSSADLIRPTGSGDGDYTFLHALARDAAYETILIRQRRRYHRQVADVIEICYPDRLDEESPRLAYHFAEARDWARAVHYYAVAGETAAKIYAHAEAIEHFGRAIELALAAPSAVDDETLANLFLRRGRIYELDGLYDEALNTYEALEALGRERSIQTLELAGLAPQVIIYAMPNYRMDATLGAEMANRTLQLSQRLNRPDAEARANWGLMLLYINVEVDLAKAIEYGERALALAREYDFKEIEAYTLNDIGRAYGMMGQIEAALAAFAGARALWQELGNDHMLSDALAVTSQGLLLSGHPADAVAQSRQGLAIAHRIGNQWGESLNSYALGYALLELGRFGEAFDLFRQSVELAEHVHFQGPGATIPIVLAWSYGQIGAPAYQRALLTEWLERAPASEDADALRRMWTGITYHFDGQSGEALAWVSSNTPSLDFADRASHLFTSVISPAILLANDRFQETLAIEDEMLDLMQTLGLNAFLVDHLRYRGLALMGLGDRAGAREMLVQAYAAAREQQNRRTLWLVLADLVALESDGEARAAYRAEAINEINFLADNMPDLELREAFLSQSAVRELLAVS